MHIMSYNIHASNNNDFSGLFELDLFFSHPTGKEITIVREEQFEEGTINLMTDEEVVPTSAELIAVTSSAPTMAVISESHQKTMSSDFPIGCRVAHVSVKNSKNRLVEGTVRRVVVQRKRAGYGLPQVRIHVKWDKGCPKMRRTFGPSKLYRLSLPSEVTVVKPVVTGVSLTSEYSTDSGCAFHVGDTVSSKIFISGLGVVTAIERGIDDNGMQYSVDL